MEETEVVIVQVVEVRPHWILVQYEEELPEGELDKKYIQRKLIPWAVFPVARKGAARIQRRTLEMGLEYSNVDLRIGLGGSLPAIRICDVEDALRRLGLWSQQDYRNHPRKVAGVLQRLRKVDVSVIMNAALAGPQES